ncbi:helix-turn-helix transcriptional regulator [Clostridium perfringens]|uniref:helix-turn-helix domain-containing protein n=1 Tax=Clostridium perfringens TaxID=1502 RepID=UPI002972E7E4|nr:helix-turn-helix transcriptional regulator [Clostridium perfringens]MDM0849072.1 helix-turn-helix transcriptional regulator [Clostridium perfringens]MDM0869821.1 helix-turn-helix transcriptional regulator [Clostridium perfringens]MDM0872749.1 helix-turn-helix transcriptional regulator [Clostridium perfringens]
MYTLGKRIKYLRIKNNYTQKELAEFLNIALTTLSQYENDKRKPNDDLKIQLALLFNVSLDYLMGLTEQPIPYYKLFDSANNDDDMFIYRGLLSLDDNHKYLIKSLIKSLIIDELEKHK